MRNQARSSRRGRWPAVLVGLLGATSLVWAAGGIIELEVVEAKWNDGRFEVAARHAKTRLPLRFTLRDDIFEGSRFTARVAGLERGSLFSVQGPSGHPMKAERLTYLEPDADYPAEERRQRGGGRQAGGEQFTVTKVDGRRSRLTAVSPEGTRIEFTVDPAAWYGYPIQLRPADLVLGEGFPFVTPNREPIKSCCRLEEIGG